MSGALQLHRSGLVALDFLDSMDDSYGVAEEGLATDDNAVEIPENTFTLRDDHFQELKRSIDPLCNSSNIIPFPILISDSQVPFVAINM